MQALRKYENLHIVFWLIKDTCWNLEWKILGICMILPTLSIAVYIAYHSRKTVQDYWHNLAIIFWILANSYWMTAEFVNHPEQKHWALIPFTIGFVCLIYYYAIARYKKQVTQ
jgi:hypothetical protein